MLSSIGGSDGVPPIRKGGDEIIHSKVTMDTGYMLGVLKLQVAGGMEALGSESRSVLEQRQEGL